MTNTATARAQSFTASLATKQLIAALVAIGPMIDAERAKARETKNYDECQTLNRSRSWMITELEARYPYVIPALDAAFEADEDADYVTVLVAAIREADKR